MTWRLLRTVVLCNNCKFTNRKEESLVRGVGNTKFVVLGRKKMRSYAVFITNYNHACVDCSMSKFFFFIVRLCFDTLLFKTGESLWNSMFVASIFFKISTIVLGKMDQVNSTWPQPVDCRMLWSTLPLIYSFFFPLGKMLLPLIHVNTSLSGRRAYTLFTCEIIRDIFIFQILRDVANPCRSLDLHSFYTFGILLYLIFKILHLQRKNDEIVNYFILNQLSHSSTWFNFVPFIYFSRIPLFFALFCLNLLIFLISDVAHPFLGIKS